MQVTPVTQVRLHLHVSSLSILQPSCVFRVEISSCSLNLVNSVIHQSVTGTASSGQMWSQILKRQGTESSLISAATQFLSRLSEHLKGEIYAPAAEAFGLPERGENLNGPHARSYDVCSPSSLWSFKTKYSCGSLRLGRSVV